MLRSLQLEHWLSLPDIDWLTAQKECCVSGDTITRTAEDEDVQSKKD